MWPLTALLESMPRAAPVSKKPVAKTAARPTVVASHVPLGKHLGLGLD